jgi:membrane fusion protein, multidrug efflux system
MRMRSLILLCLMVAVIGAMFVWGRYYKTDPVSAEAAMQQQAPALAPTQNAQQAAPQSTPQPAPESGRPAVAVRVAEVTQASMPIRRRTIGWVEPIATVAIKSRINSVIMEQHATDGAFVNKGDVLFVLDDREAKATIARDEAAMAQHQAEVERARGDLERTKTLVAKQTASKQTLDQVVAAARAAEAAVEADKAVLQADRLTLSYTTIAAPISGRLGAIAVTPGNLVSENGDVALVTITQMQPIRLSFTSASSCPTATSTRCAPRSRNIHRPRSACSARARKPRARTAT